MRSSITFLFLCFNCLSCYKNHFYVQQEWIDKNFLASSHVHTPDPKQKDYPVGQRLTVSWDFPRSIFQKHLSLSVIVRFWDDTQQVLERSMTKNPDFAVFYFPHDVPGVDQKILTYKVVATSAQGEVVGSWEHQLWTKLIDINPNK